MSNIHFSQNQWECKKSAPYLEIAWMIHKGAQNEINAPLCPLLEGYYSTNSLLLYISDILCRVNALPKALCSKVLSHKIPLHICSMEQNSKFVCLPMYQPILWLYSDVNYLSQLYILGTTRKCGWSRVSNTYNQTCQSKNQRDIAITTVC